MTVGQTYTYKYKLPPGLRNKDDIDKKNAPTYPLLNIQLYNPDGGKAKSFEGLVDSGADGLFIPKQIAENLGLEKIDEIETAGILKSSECIKTKVGFRIGRSKARRIDFEVIEATYPKKEGNIPILVGRKPLFEYFEVKFLEYKESPKIKLTQKNSLS